MSEAVRELIRRDLRVFLADEGEPVSFAGSPPDLVGLVEMHDVQTLGDDGRGMVIGRYRGVRLQTWAVDGLAAGAAFTVGRKNYRVRSVEAEPIDGLFSIVFVLDAI